MLKTDISIEQIVKELVNFLSRYIKIERIILYGSYAYGIARGDSDFDIAVISEDFERMSILERIELFSKAIIGIDSRIEAKGFSKKEFLKPQESSFLAMIKNKGKIVY
ncbi:MAG: nucleotidyltransferase domain-containing protein [Candidatus Omnitrophica bacterium]|nr:nucleotidyltransferase domain-containing protein [Candidatus Omnitrophota bacterium]MBU0896466.1 nucleotidyltransferase domain-containing protein [Candidatus Omnitrophota bacterium]MBU1133373.1 nucleotidyltransferase domain-containing protein [Candidatus Omnitrophota bacterium]MBU1367705.1 nucleotidyltransferase domain-containing protein [Candidatus Omnitrophota bacterium]MBU1810760.1 nucleotidyltransferase domain-containing protein [Candidatus Omnitrophota bacterium]